MIIWLASYPKSGNTWLRAFIASLLYGSNQKKALENIKNIRSYPLTIDFENLIDDFKDFKKISQNWLISQKIINLQKKITLFKTHHILCKINNNSFTDYNNSLGAINIVRDPRNVITSIKNFYSLKDYDEALKFMCDEKRFLGKFDKKNMYERETQFPTFISSWGNHYKSWKNFKKNLLLIKYEDLIDKPEKTFGKISKFLSKLLQIQITDKKIINAINESSFDKLKVDEEKFGYIEAPINKDTNTKIQIISSNGGTNRIVFGDKADQSRGDITYNHSDESLAFSNNNLTERMRIDSSGNLKFNSGYGSAATAYGCRAWVNFNGSGTVSIRASGNVSSITDRGAGKYTVNISNALTDANYTVTFGSPSFNPGNPPWVFQEDYNISRTTTGFGMWTNQNGNSYDSAYVQLAIFR